MDSRLLPLPRGTVAPEFTLPKSSHAVVSLADFRRRRVILVFYPADWEPVSRQQLVLYQEYLDEFVRLSAVPLAVSVDHVWCHIALLGPAASSTRCLPTVIRRAP
jgi:peroxiredoxin